MKKEKIKTIDGVAEELGVLKERGRILDELGKAGLPAGVWALIQNITDEYGQLHEEEKEEADIYNSALFDILTLIDSMK